MITPIPYSESRSANEKIGDDIITTMTKLKSKNKEKDVKSFLFDTIPNSLQHPKNCIEKQKDDAVREIRRGLQSLGVSHDQIDSVFSLDGLLKGLFIQIYLPFKLTKKEEQIEQYYYYLACNEQYMLIARFIYNETFRKEGEEEKKVFDIFEFGGGKDNIKHNKDVTKLFKDMGY